MQATPSGGGRGGGGGGVNRVGLARFRSAPPTWLEALLEEEEDEEDPLKPSQTLTQLLTSNTSKNTVPFGVEPGGGVSNLFEPAGVSGGGGAFARQNSSPADFSLNRVIGNEGYYSNFGIGSNYEYTSSNTDVSSSAKRARDVELHHSSIAKYPSLLKGEQNNQAHVGGGGMSSLIEMEMEKLLEDSVPCRVRAKRGCATHPRSIAERVRRTRISDRIRKLQELVPNMDKQTNTADMLDEAVGYVKFLQRQIQELREHQMRCTCMAKE